MNATQHSVMEKRSSAIVPKPSSGIKTILFHVMDEASLGRRLDGALAVARACGAHLSCLHVTPIEAYVAPDTFGGIFVMNDIMRSLDERDAELRKKVEDRLRRDDVSWNYEQVTGNVESVVIGQAALADLLITARPPLTSDFVGPTIGFVGQLLLGSRTPLFIPGPDPAAFDPTGAALIAWNGSFEAANAVRGSVGLLRLAGEVRVLEITEQVKTDRTTFPGTKLLEYLSRQGVHARLAAEPSPTGDTGYDVVAAAIASEAERRSAYIVMGGYSHSRISEWVFGGVTRALLRDCPVPLVMAQ